MFLYNLLTPSQNNKKQMNLTLTNSPYKGGIIHYPNREITFIQPSYQNINNPQPPSYSCGALIFSNCIDHDEQVPKSQINEVYETHTPNNGRQINQNVDSKEGMHSLKAKKISLSLCRHPNNNQIIATPKKQSRNNANIARVDRNKRIKTHSSNEKYPSFATNKQAEYEQNKHLHPYNHNTANMHQIQLSMQPSTPKRPKKQEGSTSKKSKLTLSNIYKSQIQPEIMTIKERRHQESNGRQVINTISPQQVKNEDTFITPKLQNIYSQMISDSNNPNSNITYYNKMIMNDQFWKHQNTHPSSQTDFQKQSRKLIDSQLLSNPHSSCNSKDLSKLDLSRQIENESQRHHIKQMFKERKWIGQYAPTIKTFNESDFRSEQESIVLERGPGPRNAINPFQTANFQRGSIKAQQKQTSGQRRRAYNSFGGQGNEGQPIRTRQWESHPIEEDYCHQQS